MSYKRWIIIAVCLFFVGIAVGFFTPAASLPSEYVAGLEELTRFLAPYSILTLIFIFVKNVLSLLISFVFSPILLLAPIFSLVLNGWVIAFVSGAVVQEKSIGYLLTGILPHGIFELAAFVLGEAAALSFGAMVILALINRKRRDQLLPNIKRNLRYLGIACALLLLAAVIETYITPFLLTGYG